MCKVLEDLLPTNVVGSSLMRLALTHRSIDAMFNNERLEFLGDTALGLAVSQWLFERRAHWTEGDMSRLRSTLVNRDALFEIGQHVGLPDYIALSDSVSDIPSQVSPRVVAGTVEAVIGAVYLQCDWETTQRFILNWLAPLLKDVPDDPQDAKDNKTALQEWLQARGLRTPIYKTMLSPARAGAREFIVQCQGGGARALGSGSSKKKAELQAAGILLERLSRQKAG